ncbi:MAG: putative peptidoglycan glycosyltransferase FtsW [Campylobacterota bacterium]|nr:putative peptidoglycan glycosyltransferase FtsW [Campylobacterota bacterium]
MIDRHLLFAVIALLTFSIIFSYSLATYTVLHFEYSPYHFLIRQTFAVGIGISIIVALSWLDPDKWFNPMGLTLFLFFFILLITMQFFPSNYVSAVSGAKRWIKLGSFSIAPVEFFKIGFVFFLAWSFSRKLLDREAMSFKEEIKVFFPYIIVFFVAVLLIAILQKDLGQVVVLGGTLAVLFLFAGSSFKFFLSLLGGALMGIALLILSAPHRIARVASWWGSVQDKVLAIFPFEVVQELKVEVAKEPYQISNSLNAIHNGGWSGQGLSNGQFELGYLSEVHTDFVLSGIAEEFGFLGILLVTGLILFIIYRIFKIAALVQNPTYYLFSVGVGLVIALSFIINSFGISGLFPIKGIAVPFLSYGGSHIIASSLAIGLVLMISKKRVQKAEIDTKLFEEIQESRNAYATG